MTLVKIALATDLEVHLGTTKAVAGPAEYIHQFLIFGLGLVGVAALAAITYGGFLYLVSGGSETRKSEGKDWITGAVWGVLLLFCSYLILNTINPDLVSLKEPKVEPIAYKPLETFTEEDIFEKANEYDLTEEDKTLLTGPNAGAVAQSIREAVIRGQATPLYTPEGAKNTDYERLGDNIGVLSPRALKRDCAANC